MYSYLWLLTISLVLLTNGYKHGAPLSSCNLMLPSPSKQDGHGAAPSNSEPPYRLEIFDAFNKPISEYSPGSKEALRIAIVGEKYRGFILQARSLLGAGRRVGHFIEPLPAGSQFLDCDGEDSRSAVTHDCGHPKYELRFLWPTPRHNIGPVQFVATVVHNQSLFWTNVQSLPLYPKNAALSTETVNRSRCGRGFGCFRTGDNVCESSREPCNFTLVWKCLSRHVLFEFVAAHPKLSFKHLGMYFGLAESNDDQLGDDHMFVCQIFRNETKIMVYANYKNKSYLLPLWEPVDVLKLESNSNQVYCRFARRLLLSSSEKEKHYFFVSGKILSDGSLEKPRKTNIPIYSGKSLNICSHPDFSQAVKTNNALSNINFGTVNSCTSLLANMLYYYFYVHLLKTYFVQYET